MNALFRPVLYSVSLLIACAATLLAQMPPPALPPVSPRLGVPELRELLGPIALYPDPLISIILPASTLPSDVVMGARYLERQGDPILVDNQPWDESVKALVRYPDVLAWMSENLEWTYAVGEAFIEQPEDVMNVIQELRNQAIAAGNLNTTPQQIIVVEERIVRIYPAEPEIIYVPLYDPQIVYVQSYAPSPLITFGIGFAVGRWLNYDCDWNRRHIYRGEWRGWNQGNYRQRDRSSQNINVVTIDSSNARQWQPSARSRREISQRQQNQTGNARFANARAKTSETNGEAAVASTGRNRSTSAALPAPTRLNVRGGNPDANRATPENLNATPPPPASDSVSSPDGTPPRKRNREGLPVTPAVTGPSATPPPLATSTPPAGRPRPNKPAPSVSGEIDRPATPPTRKPQDREQRPPGNQPATTESTPSNAPPRRSGTRPPPAPAVEGQITATPAITPTATPPTPRQRQDRPSPTPNATPASPQRNRSHNPTPLPPQTPPKAPTETRPSRQIPAVEAPTERVRPQKVQQQPVVPPPAPTVAPREAREPKAPQTQSTPQVQAPRQQRVPQRKEQPSRTLPQQQAPQIPPVQQAPVVQQPPPVPTVPAVPPPVKESKKDES